VYTWVEEQNHAPTVALEILTSLNKELHKQLIMALAVPGWDATVGTAGEILQESTRILIRW